MKKINENFIVLFGQRRTCKKWNTFRKVIKQLVPERENYHNLIEHQSTDAITNNPTGDVKETNASSHASPLSRQLSKNSSTTWKAHTIKVSFTTALKTIRARSNNLVSSKETSLIQSTRRARQHQWTYVELLINEMFACLLIALSRDSTSTCRPLFLAPYLLDQDKVPNILRLLSHAMEVLNNITGCSPWESPQRHKTTVNFHANLSLNRHFLNFLYSLYFVHCKISEKVQKVVKARVMNESTAFLFNRLLAH